MNKLTPEMIAALRSTDKLPEFQDEETHRVYVLVDRDAYLQHVGEESERTREELRQLIDEGMTGEGIPASKVFADLRLRAEELANHKE